MTDRTTLWFSRLILFLLPRHGNEAPSRVSTRRIKADDIKVLIVRKSDLEFRNEIVRLRADNRDVAEAGKQKPRRVARSDIHVAVRADGGRGSFTSEELCSMTGKARGVFGKIRNVRKCGAPFTNLVPILRWELGAGITSQLLLRDMSVMRK